MKKEPTIMTSLAKRVGTIALCTALGMATVGGTAYAYFTSNTQASGGHTIELGYSSEIKEGIEDGSKNITMENTGNTEIMVRVQLFYGTGVNGSITVREGADGTDTGWSQKDGMWVWEGVLAPHATTGSLMVDVEATAGTDLSNFDVTVIGQTSPVYYNEKNEPVPYLWQTAAPDGKTTPVPGMDNQE